MDIETELRRVMPIAMPMDAPAPPEDQHYRPPAWLGRGGVSAAKSYVPLEPVPTTSGSDQALFITSGTFGQNAEKTAGDSMPKIGIVSISTGGGSRPKVVLGGGEQCVYLTVSVNSDKQVTGVTVDTSSSSFPPSSTDETAYVPLGTLTYDDDGAVIVDRNLGGSQTYAWCAGHQWGLA